MLGFDGVGAFGFDEGPAGVGAEQDVHCDEHAAGLEAGFEDGRRGAGKRGLGRGEALGAGVMRVVDEDPAGELEPGELADLAALVEEVEEDLIGLELGGVGFVDGPPEELLALVAVGEAGFGKVRH